MSEMVLVKSTVWTCARCGAWFSRTPAWFSPEAFGKGDYCLKCKNTSVNSREGRAYGPKSREWDNLKEYFENNWEDILEYAPYSVIVKKAD